MHRKSTRKVGHPPLTFKNILKDILKRGGVLDTWKETVADRPVWRKLISDVCAKINSKRHDKRTLKEKKEMNFELIDIIYQKYLSFIYLCPSCSRQLRSLCTLYLSRVGSLAYINTVLLKYAKAMVIIAMRIFPRAKKCYVVLCLCCVIK